MSQTITAEQLAERIMRELGDDPEALALVLETTRVLAARSRGARRRISRVRRRRTR